MQFHPKINLQVHSQYLDQRQVMSGTSLPQAADDRHQSPSETSEIVGFLGSGTILDEADPSGTMDWLFSEGDWFGSDVPVTGGSGSGMAQSHNTLPYPSQVLKSWRLPVHISSITR
jgi:hypothetical protein